MTAVVQHRYGPPQVLAREEMGMPVVGDREVLLRVRAAGLNAGDGFIMRGVPYFLRLFGGLRRPRHGVRGVDVAGTVAQVGAGVTDLRPGEEVTSFGRAEAMMIGKARPLRYLNAGGAERCEKLFWIGNACERQDLAPADRVDNGPIRFEPAVKKGNPAPFGTLDDACGAFRHSDHDQRLRAIKLPLQRSTQRSGGNDAAIADAAPTINENKTQVLSERRILKTIIHNDDARSGGTCQCRSSDAVARDDGRR